MNLQELKAAAEDCNAFCNKCGYIGKSEPNHTRIPVGTEMPTQCNYQAMRMMHVHNATLLKLIAVVEVLQKYDGDRASDPYDEDMPPTREWEKARRIVLKELEK
jgi:hypothetical protein